MIKLIRAHLKGFALACAILAPLCMLVEVFMDLQQPTLMSQIIDIGVAGSDMAFVLRTGGRMLLYAFIGVLGGAGCSICASYAATQMGGSVRETLFEKIFSLSSAEIDRLETSSLITRTTSDVTLVQEMLTMMLRGMSRGPMLFFGGIIMAFTLSPRLALILCVVLPLLIVAGVVIVRRAVGLYTAVQQQMDRVNTVMRENLLGIRVIKAFTLENARFARFQRVNERFAGDSIRAQSATYLLMPIVTLAMNLCVVAVLWFGGLMEMAGDLALGRIMAFVNYAVQITNALLMLVNFAVSISRAQASARRVTEVLRTDASVKPPEHPMLPTGSEVRFEHVTFGYGGDPVLEDVSLTIPPGAKVGIIGATGSGKSTIAALTARLYDPDQGRITLGVVDIRNIPLDALRKRVGIVLQTSVLFSGTVADNLRYGDRDAGEPALWTAARAAEAAEFLETMSEGLQSTVAQRGRNFSGGQKQRISIARSLLQNPQVLVLDDATSAVDFLTEARLQQAIRSRMQEATLVIIAQRISSIMDCDTIYVMEGGRIAAEGDHASLLAQSRLYHDIALSQLGEEGLVHA